MRRLIINADDFGLTAGINRSIVEGYRSGLITSATLMANSSFFDDAVRRVASEPRLSVGCHVTLLDGAPLLPPAQVPSLLASPGRDAHFRDSLSGFAVAAVRGRIDASQIEAEAMAQLSRIQNAGIRLSHFDAHKHTHLLPAVLRPLLKAARACGVRAVRNPFAPAKPLALGQLMRRPGLWKRYAQVKVLRPLAGRFRDMVNGAGLVTTDGSLGIVETGTLDETLFRTIVGYMPEGTWELVCHPGYNDADLSLVRTRLRASREKELRLLTSNAARQALKEFGVQLISYWELQQEGGV